MDPLPLLMSLCFASALLLTDPHHRCRARMHEAAGRAPPVVVPATQELAAADIADHCDVLAACLGAGMSPRDALGVLATLLDSAHGAVIQAVMDRLAVGMPAHLAWDILPAESPLTGIGALFIRSERSGAPLKDAVIRHAVGVRSHAHAEVTAKAQRAGVYITAPLGLCFLPAFIVIGIVPVVVGLARDMF